MNATIDADDVRARVRELPNPPQVVHEILAAMNDEDLNLDALARRIAIDPAFVTRLLRAANSPFYGMSGSIASVQAAVQLIGLRTVSALFVSAVVRQSIAPPKCPEFDFGAFWKHSLATAVCAQELARGGAAAPTIAFTVGLLHDLGELVLATYYPSQLGEAIRRAEREDCPLHEAEESVLGVGHAQIGAWIAAQWRFADAIGDAIRQHHAPAIAPASAGATLPDIVHTADGIVHALDLAGVEDDCVPRLQLASWERLGLASDSCLRLFRRTEMEFVALREALA